MKIAIMIVVIIGLWAVGLLWLGLVIAAGLGFAGIPLSGLKHWFKSYFIDTF